ncbi:DUF3379 family protein [Pelomicrobium sp. G1]|uniref:DUF3379 family protein n=1 Tax=unclassified Pelomicrobium TaxID=2815318 RepID=UPI003F768F5A
MERTPMTCLEFRREALADPRRLSPAAEAHRRGCPGCAEHLERLRRLDEDLGAAARVPVPDGLADRILLRHHLEAPGRRAWMAKAAGLAAAAAVGGWLIHEGSGDAARPALAAIDHVLGEEPRELAIGRRGDERVLARVLEATGLTLRQARDVRYTGTCAVYGTYAHHVILYTPLGKATLLVFPDLEMKSPVVAERNGAWARVASAGIGSFAVVAPSREQAQRIADALRA